MEIGEQSSTAPWRMVHTTLFQIISSVGFSQSIPIAPSMATLTMQPIDHTSAAQENSRRGKKLGEDGSDLSDIDSGQLGHSWKIGYCLGGFGHHCMWWPAPSLFFIDAYLIDKFSDKIDAEVEPVIKELEKEIKQNPTSYGGVNAQI